MSRTYIIPFDGSTYAKQALIYAINSGRDNDRFVLLNVQTQEDHRLFQQISEKERQQYYIDEGNKILSLVDDVLAIRKSEVIKEVRIGYPSLEIANIAKEYDAYGIIMGSRGLSPSVGNVLGSVTYGVIHLAPCPITIVPHVEQS